MGGKACTYQEKPPYRRRKRLLDGTITFRADKSSLNCGIIKDLIRFAKELESRLQQDSVSNALMHRLRPQLTLVGSVAEKTRIGLASEIDLGMTFRGWSGGSPPFRVGEDPYSLRRSTSAVQVAYTIVTIDYNT